jgi:ATP-binding cassette subfamily F protein 3
LLLDEPTNHLDLDMRHALATALQEFVGALVVVSHDRHLLRTVADQMLLVDGGNVSPFDGDLEDYHRWVRESTSQEEIKQSSAPKKKQLRQQAAEQRLRLQPLQKRVTELEQKLELLHRQRQDIQERMLDQDLYSDENKELLTDMLHKQRDIDVRIGKIEGEWMLASDELEQAGS